MQFLYALNKTEDKLQFCTKIKKSTENQNLTLTLQQNQDILKEISTLNKNRPELIIGFSLETDNLEEKAKEKLKNKSCDWIIANGHHNGKESVFDSEMNSVKLIKNDSLGNNLTKNFELKCPSIFNKFLTT